MELLMPTKTINISKEFSKFPGGRVLSDGPYSGEGFRDEILIPALEQNDSVTLIIDGVMGYGSSFLEECFGGLIRKGKTAAELKQKLHLKYDNPEFEMYEKEIWEYIQG